MTGSERQPAGSLRIAGLTRLSSVDWPGRLVATCFLQGCPWDCVYCHNPDLIDPRAPGAMAWDDVARFLRRRVGLLDAVVFSGGEPTLQHGLLDAVTEVRELGFAVGLHSGGAYPRSLQRLLPLIDWIGLDVKALPEGYAAVTGRGPSGSAAMRSLDLVLRAARARAATERPLEVEVRTTVHPDLVDDAQLAELGELLADRGVTRWALQRFRSVGSRCGEPRGAPRRLDRLPAARFESLVVR